MGDTVLADRPEQHAGERSVAPTAYHQKVGVSGLVDQNRRRVALSQDRSASFGGSEPSTPTTI